MALTAASPFFRGFLADTDCRWDVISASVDDRTPGERGVAPLQEGEQRVSTSRYSPAFLYIDDNEAVDQAVHNDVPVELDEETLQRLRASGTSASRGRAGVSRAARLQAWTRSWPAMLRTCSCAIRW